MTQFKLYLWLEETKMEAKVYWWIGCQRFGWRGVQVNTLWHGRGSDLNQTSAVDVEVAAVLNYATDQMIITNNSWQGCESNPKLRNQLLTAFLFQVKLVCHFREKLWGNETLCKEANYQFKIDSNLIYSTSKYISVAKYKRVNWNPNAIFCGVALLWTNQLLEKGVKTREKSRVVLCGEYGKSMVPDYEQSSLVL